MHTIIPTLISAPFEFVVIFIIGLLFGSFFNVVIWRTPRNESIISPPSHCPKCNKKIAWWENIPVISYLLLQGKCSKCKEKISIIYPLIELTTGLIAFVFWFIIRPTSFSPWWEYIAAYAKLFSIICIIPIIVIDLKHLIIPNQITIPGFIAASFISLLPGDTTPLQALEGVLIGAGSLYFMGFIGKILFKKDSMGGGDIKLMAFLGAMWGPSVAIMTIILASFVGSFIGIALMGLKKLGNDHLIPFGPFLGIGFWISVAYGDKLVNLYLTWSGFR